MAVYKNLKLAEFEAAILTGSNVIVLDVRTKFEFETGHLETAHNVPDINAVIDELDPSKHYYLHCRVGGRSALAAQLLVMKGFKHVFNLNDKLENTTLSLVKEKVLLC